MTKRELYPMMFIQCDWNTALRHLRESPESKAFITFKYRGENGVHGHLRSSLTGVNGKVKLVADPHYTVLHHNSNSISLKHESGLHASFVAPIKSFELHEKAALSVDVSDSALVVSSSDDDSLLVWDGRTGERSLELKGHGGPVYKCRFFPSGVVALSAGADGSLRVWCAKEGVCPVTLKGHRKAVNDFAIVDRGRNVISVSKDGFVKLWDVGASDRLADVDKVDSEINCCCLLTTDEKRAVDDPREVGTEDKLVFIGCEDGSFRCSRVALRELVFEGKMESAINCCVRIEGDVIVGCENGKVSRLSGENGSVLSEWWESSSPVRGLCDLSGGKFCIGHADGSCVVRSPLSQHADARVYLTGPDVDGINDIAFNGRWVFTSCRDSHVRKYDFNQIAVHFK